MCIWIQVCVVVVVSGVMTVMMFSEHCVKLTHFPKTKEKKKGKKNKYKKKKRAITAMKKLYNIVQVQQQQRQQHEIWVCIKRKKKITLRTAIKTKKKKIKLLSGWVSFHSFKFNSFIFFSLFFLFLFILKWIKMKEINLFKMLVMLALYKHTNQHTIVYKHTSVCIYMLPTFCLVSNIFILHVKHSFIHSFLPFNYTYV